jgi:uncharacterized membrane protein
VYPLVGASSRIHTKLDASAPQKNIETDSHIFRILNVDRNIYIKRHKSHTYRGDRIMRDVMLILHFIGLAMGLGTSFGFMFLGMASSKMAPEEAGKFRMQTFVLSRMGHIGLALLIISGGYLMTPFWPVLGDSPLLMAKLLLVLVLAALIGIISGKVRKAKTGDSSQLRMVEPLGKVSLLTGILIVVLAVLVFH